MSSPKDLNQLAIVLDPRDTVAVARQVIQAGTMLRLPGGEVIRVGNEVPAGHKLALHSVPRGEVVLRYGQPIGQASAAFAPGDWVHTHNLEVGEIDRTAAYRLIPVLQPEPTGRTFDGYLRPDGQVGVRNLIAVVSTVTCSAHAVSQIVRAFTPEKLAAYPNVDGVAAVLHHSGCSMPPGGLSYQYLRRSLVNLARNPNIAAAVYVGLGCEVMQVSDCQPPFESTELGRLGAVSLVIQEQGGFNNTVNAGIAAVEKLLIQVNACKRSPQPLAKLKVALQCGGSDGWSGVTANPLVGRFVDRLVCEGGTAVLAETPEIFGAEHLLIERVSAPEVGEKLRERVNAWVEQARLRGFSMDNNPTPGNKSGGLTTIFEKSLGAVAKGGSSPLKGVYEYAEWVERSGLVFMDTPGNDPASITGQLAGGCNLILFTTGRGTVYGSALAPCIKVASSSALAARMGEDMDVNAGRLLEGQSWEEAEAELAALVTAVASGQKTKSELHGRPECEFVPWQPDSIL